MGGWGPGARERPCLSRHCSHSLPTPASAEADHGPERRPGCAAEPAAEAAAEAPAGGALDRDRLQPPPRPLLAGHEAPWGPVCLGRGRKDPPPAPLNVGALGSLETPAAQVPPALTTHFLCSLHLRRPKSEKDAKEVPEATQNPVSMKRKKKGFLPETKKRKKRKSEGAVQGEGAAPAATGGDQPPSTGKKRRNKRKAKVPAPSQVNGMPAAKSPAPDSPAQPPKPKKRKRKQSQVNGTPATKSPAPDSPAQTPKPQKQNEKQSQVNATPAIESPAPDLSAQTPKPQKKNPKLSQVNGTPATRSPAPDPPTQTPKLQKKNQKLSQMKGATPESLDSPEEPAAKKRPKKNLPQKGILGKSPQSALPRKKARLSLASRSPSLLQSGARKKVQPRKVKKL